MFYMQKFIALLEKESKMHIYNSSLYMYVELINNIWITQIVFYHL